MNKKKIKKKKVKKILNELLQDSLVADVGEGRIEYKIDGNRLYTLERKTHSSL
jgi:hypothetical protein